MIHLQFFSFNSNCLFLLILVIMVQNPKSGGLSSAFGGVPNGRCSKKNRFLRKNQLGTLGGALILLILLSTLSFSNGNFSLKFKMMQFQNQKYLLLLLLLQTAKLLQQTQQK